MPTPRPCQSSITVTAASAMSGRSARRMKRATPTPVARLGIERGKRLVVVVVDVGEVGEVGLAERRHRREEALVARLGAEALEARPQPLAVVGAHRAHDDPGAVAQGDGGPGVVRCRSRLVEAVDAVAVALVDHRALDLQRRRQLAVGLREVARRGSRSA